jgi:hypothetical protein
MTQHLRTVFRLAATTIFLLGVGTPAAFAEPAPLIEREFLPPEQTATTVSDDVSFSTQLGWMLTGAGVALAITAIVLVAVLWHRGHAGGHRLATP